MNKRNIYDVVLMFITMLAVSMIITACGDGGGSSEPQTTDRNLGEVPPELVDPPQLAQWEANMDLYGRQLGEVLMNYSSAELTSSEARNDVYYDGQRVFFQIADYTGRAEPWNTYAQRAEQIYRDNYAIPNAYMVAGHIRFPHGLYMDHLRTGDTLSTTGIPLMRDNPPLSNPEISGIAYKWYWSGLSREVAYALESHIIAERAGHLRNTVRVSLYIDMALNHIHEWVTGDYGQPETQYQRVAPFMIGLTAEALISFYEWEVEQGHAPDETIPNALKSIADHLMVVKVKSGPNVGLPMWIENYDNTGYGCFRYEDSEISGTGTNPAPVLNMLVAPLYAWLFKHYGDIKYLEMGDKIFAGGVVLTGNGLGYAGKFFNQNYRLSFDFVKYRKEGLAIYYQ